MIQKNHTGPYLPRTGLIYGRCDMNGAGDQKFLTNGQLTMATETTQPTLNPHLEHFDGITSAVMCPHT
eukprot:COSAG05_NODE_11115_length_530_cov_0.647332_1_plen_68_part_00